MLRLTDETFKPPDDFDLKEYMRHSFKVMHDDLHQVKVRISSGWSQYVGEKIWHESQDACKLPDGSLELTFHVDGLDEIKQWVMGFGPEACVEEPEELRKLVKEGLKRTLAHYEKTSFEYREKIESRAKPQRREEKTAESDQFSKFINS